MKASPRSVFPAAFFILAALLIPLQAAVAQPKWVPISSGTTVKLHSVSFSDSLNGVAAGDGGHFIRTTDGGYSWFAGMIPDVWWLSDVVHAAGNALFMNGRVPCYDIDCGIMLQSTDAGTSWFSEGGSTFDPTEAISFADSSSGVAVGGNFNGWTGETYSVVLRTTDGGSEWRGTHAYAGGSLVMDRLTDVAFTDTGFCVAICGNGQVLRYIRDSTDIYQVRSLWETLAVLLPGLRSVGFTDTLNGVISGDAGRIWRTTDGGKTWTAVASGTGVTLRSVQLLTGGVGFIAGGDGTILRTTDGGSGWLPESGVHPVNLNRVFFTDTGHGWAVGDGGAVLRYGEFPLCVLASREIDFGDVVIGSGSEDSVMVSNPGSDTLTISAGTDNADFTVQPAYEIPPGDSAWITVRFFPSAIGPANAALILGQNTPTSPDTVRLRGMARELDTTEIALARGWHIVSVPRIVANDSAAAVFPGAGLPVYRYDPDSGYLEAERLETGEGYWARFPRAETLDVPGFTILSDTIAVRAGWNLIGTISLQVTIGSVKSDPPGIVASGYFGYDRGYEKAAILVPGRGYWVKASSDGVIILSPP